MEMKKICIFIVGLFVMFMVSCAPTPSGNPKQDLATFHKLLNEGKASEASQFCDDVMEYYSTHFSGPEAKQKLQEFGDNM